MKPSKRKAKLQARIKDWESLPYNLITPKVKQVPPKGSAFTKPGSVNK